MYDNESDGVTALSYQAPVDAERILVVIRRRTWFRLGIAAVFLAFLPLVQALAFFLFGPPGHWADSVARKPLEVKTGGEGPAQAYLEEFRRKWSQPRSPRQIQAPDGSFVGRPVLYESDPASGTELLSTDAHRLYFRRDGSWKELSVPIEISLDETRVVLRGDEIVVLASRRNPWWPFKENYRRFLKSFFDRELRPAHGLYELKLPGGELRYLCPGHRLEPSPDRRHVAFLRSVSPRGFHSLHILDVSTYKVRTLAALTEGDPGSGISFYYVWSDDSQALGLWGWLHGHRGDVELIYTLDSDSFWDVKASGEM